MIAGFCWGLLFFFVPETFWDRTPTPRSKKGSKRSSISKISIFHKPSSSLPSNFVPKQIDGHESKEGETMSPASTDDTASARRSSLHVGFAPSTVGQLPLESGPAEKRHNNSFAVPAENPASITPDGQNPKAGEAPGEILWIFCTYQHAYSD